MRKRIYTLTSQIDSKIDLLDTPEAITKKIKKAECFPKIVEGNGVLAFTEFVLLPVAALRGKKEFVVERRDAEPLVYSSIEQMHDDYRADKVSQPTSTRVQSILIQLHFSFNHKTLSQPLPRPWLPSAHPSWLLSTPPRNGKRLHSRLTQSLLCRRRRRRRRSPRTRDLDTLVPRRTELQLEPLPPSLRDPRPRRRLRRQQRRRRLLHRQALVMIYTQNRMIFDRHALVPEQRTMPEILEQHDFKFKDIICCLK